jgi:cobalt/nickel transport system permease protein
MGLTLHAARLPLWVYLRALMVPGVFLLLAGLPLMVEVSARVWWPVGFTGSGLCRALAVMARASAATAGLYLLVFTTPVPDLVSWLRGWKSAGPLADVAVALYRFIFLLQEKVAQMQMAQVSRLGYRNARTTLRSSSGLAAHLLPGALHLAQRHELALASRSLEGDWRTPTNWSCPAPTRLAACVALVAVAAWWGWRTA